MGKINKVLYNVNQRDSDSSKGNTREEMWMARNNIGLDEVIGHATVTENDKEYKGIAPLGTNGLVPTEYLKNASTGEYGVTKLTSTPGAEETLAMTPMGVQNAINTLDASVSSTGGTNVALTLTETDGVITGVRITTDDTAKAEHVHGNITGDGKVTKEGASMKAMLITNSDDQVVVGPAFGTGSDDNNLFLNKQGNWSGINEASANALGGIKIGYTKNATKYPVELSDGEAFVDVPCSEINVWKGDSSGTVHQNMMTIYEGSSTGACVGINFDFVNSTVNMVRSPSVGDGGKVLTVVEPGGSSIPYFSWLPSSSSELSLLTIRTITITDEAMVSIVDGESYSIKISGSGTKRIILYTTSTTTVHSLITVENADTTSSSSVLITYYDVTGVQCEIEISLIETVARYGFYVDIRNVENHSGNAIAIARVYDTPCAYRRSHILSYGSDTAWIGYLGLR